MRSFTNTYLWLFLLALSTTWSWIDCRPNSKQRPTCQTEACKKVAEVILSNMDKTTDPCDDFYQYACGGFINKYPEPDEDQAISQNILINQLIRRQIKESLDEPIDFTDSESVKKCKIYYRTCKDRYTIEKLSISKIWKDFKELGGWPIVEGDAWKEEEFNWAQMIFKLEELGYNANHFFDLSIVPNFTDSTKNQLELRQPTFGLPTMDLVDGASNRKIKAHSSYLRDMVKLFGAKEERINEELGEVIQFEIEMAKIFLSEEDNARVDNPMSFREVGERFSYFPWLEFLNYRFGTFNFLNESRVINVATPKYLEDFGQLSSNTSKRLLANFLFTKTFLDFVDYLPEHFLKRRDIYRAEVDGNFTKISQDEWCLNKVFKNFKFAISNLYVKKYFKKNTKELATVMVNKILESAGQNIKYINWLDEETRRNALIKLESIYPIVAYPDDLLDDKKIDQLYRDVNVNEKNYFISSLNVKKFSTKTELNKFVASFRTVDWRYINSFTDINAYYYKEYNSIVISAGILQDVYFDEDRPQYMNFGAIGMVIGHEITHAFDNSGRKYDKDGKKVNWWTPQSLKEFTNRSQCMIDQYSNVIVPELGINLNGDKCLGENIADNGGLKIAYTAYNKWEKMYGEEPLLPGIDLSPRQLFWVANAITKCKKSGKQVLESDVNATHSPDKYRVNVPFGNSKEFINDFHCKEGTRMNPYRKCSVW